MVRGEDADAVGVKERHEVHVLKDRVRRTFVPAFPVPHLRGYYVDEEITAAQRAPELPALADMLVERLALELDEAVD